MSNTNEYNHPQRYTGKDGKDLIDRFEEGLISEEQARGFLKGNILKYVTRYESKDGTKDLLKAQAYLKRLIAFEEAEKKKYEERFEMEVKEPSPVPTKNTPLDKIIELGEEYYPWLLQHPEIITGNAEVVSGEVSVRLKAHLKVKAFREKFDKWYDEECRTKKI